MVRFIFVVVLLLAPVLARAETRVDVELMLAVDVSYSMTPNELEIQRRGYAAALRDPEIARAVGAGYHGQVALSYVEWSGTNEQRVIVPWTLISTAEDLGRIADVLTAEFRPVLRRTSISGLLRFATGSFEANGFDGDRRVIDVSGDGPNNMGHPIVPVRDVLVRAGYTINGLPLMTREGDGPLLQLEDLDRYYENCVIGGPLAFSILCAAGKSFPPPSGTSWSWSSPAAARRSRCFSARNGPANRAKAMIA